MPFSSLYFIWTALHRSKLWWRLSICGTNGLFTCSFTHINHTLSMVSKVPSFFRYCRWSTCHLKAHLSCSNSFNRVQLYQIKIDFLSWMGHYSMNIPSFPEWNLESKAANYGHWFVAHTEYPLKQAHLFVLICSLCLSLKGLEALCFSGFPSVRLKPKIPSSTHTWVCWSIQPTVTILQTVCLSVHSSRDFPGISQKTHERMACNLTCWCILTTFRTD